MKMYDEEVRWRRRSQIKEKKKEDEEVGWRRGSKVKEEKYIEEARWRKEVRWSRIRRR